MQKSKRVLAILLAVLMLSSLIAALAIADDNICNVIIKYQFEDGTAAANEWSAKIGKGQTMNKTVTSPTVVGYDADKAEVTINKVIENDETIIVTYKPALVSFTVKHYKQNVDNDDYVLAETDTTKTGYTKSPVGSGLAKSYTGFTALLYDTTTQIAADGSTEVEIYYDRNYYMMKFNLGGGYGVEPIYARYGAAINVGTPVKTNAKFLGWEPETIPTTMPANDSEYTAKWEENKTANVTVVVWGENPNDENYSFQKTFVTSQTVGSQFTVPANGQVPCALEAHTHGTACYANVCGKAEHTHTQGECYTITCGRAEHTHDYTCYPGATNTEDEPIVHPSNPSNGQVYSGSLPFVGSWSRIYINGKWYSYTGSANNGTIVAPTCGRDAHTHNDDCRNITCTKEEHKHNDSCKGLICTKAEHTHNDSCSKGLNMDPTLWKFVSSETVTVAADGSSIVNVKYDRTEFTLTFRYDYSRGSFSKTGTITQKWGADIGTDFTAMNTAAGNSKWSRSSNGNSPWTSYLQIMPAENRTYYLTDTDGDEQTASYYIEKLDSSNADNTANYTLKDSITTNSDGILGITTEDAYPIEGFTFRFGYTGNSRPTKFTMNSSGNLVIGSTEIEDYGNADDRKFGGAKFYYARNSYTLSYYNYNAPLEQTHSVKYEAVLTEAPYAITPPYPSTLEPNAYEFAGWYTSQECVPGTEVKWGEMKMPAANVVVYAKWTPVQHTVKTWLTSELKAPVNLIDRNTNVQTVDHGAFAQAPADPTNGSYNFIGWFYIDDNGDEQAFMFDSMQIRKDMDVYAKWNSNALVTYTVHYQLEDGTPVADDTTGSALGGTTKTFDAKVGAELYEGYREGYFPNVKSHSITMSLDAGVENVYTFIYTPAPEVPYTVKYLEVGTERVLHAEKYVEHNRASIVTENYVAISGYMPDATQKQLIISIDPDENVITFWYSVDTQHAPVQVIHWTQNVAGDGYTKNSQDYYLTETIGSTFTATSKTISGFEFKLDKTVVTKADADNTQVATATLSAELTADGLIFNLYYDRIEYPYEFRFVNALDGTTAIADPVTGTARYGARVTHTAPDYIGNYMFVASVTVNGAAITQAQSRYIDIDIEDPANVASKNVVTFYYCPYYTIKHVQDGTLNDDITENIAITQEGQTEDLTAHVPSGYLYGGAFNAEVCGKDNVQAFAQGENAMNFTPQMGAVYYIWEPNNEYLKPRGYSVWHHDPANSGFENVIALYLASSVDRELYQEIGFNMNNVDTVSMDGKVYDMVQAIWQGGAQDGQIKEVMYVNNSPLGQWQCDLNYTGTHGGYVSLLQVNDFTQYHNYTADAHLTYQPYWITLDGIRVTGVYNRECYYKGVGYEDVYMSAYVSTGMQCSVAAGESLETYAAAAVATLNVQADNGQIIEAEDKPAAGEAPAAPERVEAPAMTIEGDAAYLRAQYIVNTIMNTAKLISAVDMDACSEAGFIINGQKFVCSTFAAAVDGYDANYLFGQSVAGAMLMSCEIALDSFADGSLLDITPYWVAADGTTVYGETRTVTYYAWCGFEG